MRIRTFSLWLYPNANSLPAALNEQLSSDLKAAVEKWAPKTSADSLATWPFVDLWDVRKTVFVRERKSPLGGTFLSASLVRNSDTVVRNSNTVGWQLCVRVDWASDSAACLSQFVDWHGPYAPLPNGPWDEILTFIDEYRCEDADHMRAGEVHHARPGQESVLKEFLLADAMTRKLPVVLVSRPDRSAEFDERSLAVQLRGIAHVIRLHPEFDWKKGGRFPFPCDEGAIRLYHRGMQATDRPEDHSSWSTYQIKMNATERISSGIAEELMQSTASAKWPPEVLGTGEKATKAVVDGTLAVPLPLSSQPSRQTELPDEWGDPYIRRSGLSDWEVD